MVTSQKRKRKANSPRANIQSCVTVLYPVPIECVVTLHGGVAAQGGESEGKAATGTDPPRSQLDRGASSNFIHLARVHVPSLLSFGRVVHVQEGPLPQTLRVALQIADHVVEVECKSKDFLKKTSPKRPPISAGEGGKGGGSKSWEVSQQPWGGGSACWLLQLRKLFLRPGGGLGGGDPLASPAMALETLC